MAKLSNIPMVSEVSICNQALSWCGQQEITSLDQKSPSAQWCRNNYPFLRDAVLQERMWTFATARAKSDTANLDGWGEQFAHDLPLEWLGVYRVYRDVSNSRLIVIDDWRFEDGKIITHYDTVYLWGIQRITNTAKFSPMFTQALAARLAADMAIPLTENRQLQVDLWNLYQNKLEDAAARDGQQGANDYITQHRLVNVRQGGGDIGIL